MLSWTNGRRMGHRLLSATLRCRQCSRAAGELVGFADRSIGESRYVPIDTGFTLHNLGGELRCGRCAGQLYLDDVEPLGKNVPLEEAGGVPFARVVAGEVSLENIRRLNDIPRLASLARVPLVFDWRHVLVCGGGCLPVHCNKHHDCRTSPW